MYIIFAYAPPGSREKQNFWEKFQSFIDSLNSPIIILGDLNEIERVSDKLGGVVPNPQRFKRLTHFMETNRLSNLETFGNEFTWRKRKQGPDNILEKLDRILVDDTVKLWYPDL